MNSNNFLYNDYTSAKKVLSHIEKGLYSCDEFIFSVAFISESGLTCLLECLNYLEKNNIKGKILTSNYLYFNKPKVLDRLLKFKNIELKIFDTNSGTGFHTKGYIFKRDYNYTIISGSSNLTSNALTTNKEWNTLISCTMYDKNHEFLISILDNFYSLWNEAIHYKDFRENYIKDYNLHLPVNNSPQTVEIALDTKNITANSMQKDFINKFLDLHKREKRALLISATGTGKTYAGALAMQKLQTKSLLFIVHREQIAKKAMESFSKIFNGEKSVALLSGNSQNFIKADFVFATIQSLHKDEFLYKFSPIEFDEIIIDEVHRAGAKSYLKVIDYFKPKFLLGMSASPDRSDDFDIYKLFNHNIVYEIRLQDALSENLLCPFHYFAISDLQIDGESLDELSSFSRLSSDERVRHIIDKATFYGYSGSRVKGLVFCSSNAEAKALSDKFNLLGFRTLSLSGNDSIETREEAIFRLSSDEPTNTKPLDYIFSVDIFNEGIDIIEVNQILMLRPTYSSIIFIQQLGRGLRKAKNKEFLVVIDFIANYKNNFLIPLALSGDKDLDKDKLRFFISQGNKSIPGSSTISFDEISKSKIYSAIDNARFDNLMELNKAYINLKQRLGKIPTYKDFDNFSTISMSKLFSISGSYPHFLSLKEKLYTKSFTSTQFEMLKFISQNLILSKKIEELLILSLLIKNFKNGKSYIDLSILKQYLYTNYNRIYSPLMLDISYKILTNRYVTSSTTAKKFKNSIFIDKIDNDKIYADANFYKLLNNSDFFIELDLLLDYGIEHYDKLYNENLYKDTLFVLYEKYTYQDICKLFSWKINYVPLAIGGYKYDSETKTLPIFINYDIDENSFNKDYTHGFLSTDLFTSMSKPKRTLDSKEISYFYKEDTKIYLFVRKNKNDKDSANEFYFLGEMKTINEPRQVHRKLSSDTVVAFDFKLLDKVKDDLYEYFTEIKL